MEDVTYDIAQSLPVTFSALSKVLCYMYILYMYYIIFKYVCIMTAYLYIKRLSLHIHATSVSLIENSEGKSPI